MARLFFKQLRALLWKALIVRRFYYIATTIELLGPLLIAIGFIVIFKVVGPSDSSTPTNSTIDPTIYPNPYSTIAFSLEDDFPSSFRLFYSPDNSTFINNLITNTFTAITGNSSVTIHKYSTGADMDEAMVNAIQAGVNPLSLSNGIGLHFEDLAPGKIGLNYTLKIPGSDTVSAVLKGRFPAKANQAAPSYDPSGVAVYSKFTTIQAYLNHAYLKYLCTPNPTSCDPRVLASSLDLNRMPYPAYPNVKVNPILTLITFILPIGCIIISPVIVLRIAEEKSTKAKELLRLMGLSDLVFWSAHFLDHFIVFLGHAVLITILFFAFGIFTFSSPILFFLLYILFAIQLTLFLLLLTTIFTKPALAVNLSTIILSLLLTATIMLIPSNSPNINVQSTNPLRLLLSFFPPSSLIWYLSLMATMESAGVGLGFATISTHTTVYLSFTAGQVFLCTAASCLLYAFLIFYIDNVSPFQHGVPRSPSFLCSPSYWFPKVADDDQTLDERDNPYKDPSFYEEDPKGLNASIRIANLTKSFKAKNKPAVDSFWLNIYENQVTILLGHNGAGKTTTMNMITGMFPSTSGTILVNNYNVITQTKAARGSIGLCTQDNVQFKELTTGQHLKLFALLKDYPNELIDGEVSEVLALLKMSEKIDVLSTKLSGGMKRRLSLGIALVGKTQILILDEPTSGMDPDTRRVIWDLLIEIRRSRTILLTTHYMEEADVLGDRIAIMNEGKLSCIGTPLFLKKTFGTGYRLRIAKSGDDYFNSAYFLTILQRYIPTVSLSTEIETEVVYSLETDEKGADKALLMGTLTRLFQDIEVNKAQYGVDSFGLSYSTLEDVFLAVGSNLDIKTSKQSPIDAPNGNALDEPTVPENQDLVLTKDSELITGYPLLANQITGLFLKRFNYARRYWKSIFLQLIIPAGVMVLVSVLQGTLRNASSSNSHIFLDLNDPSALYGPETVPFYYGSPSYLGPYQSINSEYKGNLFTIPNQTDIDTAILDHLGPDQLTEYTQKYLYGLGTFTTSNLTLWFNTEQYHSLPLSLSIFYQSLFNSQNATISTQASAILTEKEAQSSNIAMLITSWAVTCLSILPNAFLYLGASYILQPIRENTSKSKHLQLMTGLSPVTFWTVSLLFDLLTHLFIVVVLFVLSAIFDRDRIFFSSGATASALFGLLFAYGIAVIPVAYLLSPAFEKPAKGFSVLLQIFSYSGTMVGGLFAAGDLVLNYFAFDIPALRLVYELLLAILRVIPIFSVLFGYQKMYKLQTFARFCRKIEETGKLESICAFVGPGDTGNLFKGCCQNVCGDGCYMEQSSWGFTRFGSGTEIVYMFITGLVCFGIILAYELNKQQFSRVFARINLRSLFKKKPKPSVNSTTSKSTLLTEDSDVLREKSRIDHSPENVDFLTIRKLSKKFDSLTAVDGLSFGVHAEECFGLLGVNGAGKTTTFSMLTGDLFPSSGNVYIQKGRYALLEQMRPFQRSIGYCPQFDALLTKMTGEEMLYLFARLRGIPDHQMARDVGNLLRMTGLEGHGDKRIDSYSGGTKRKLSIALALIGSPKILFLDEPTSGVDPVARRKIWSTLGFLKRKEYTNSIVLTSHSMEECEALCSRIGILVNGRFVCLGSPQHLRSKYGQGYSVTLSLRKVHETSPSYLSDLQGAIGDALPSALLKDHHQNLLLYHITDQSEKWSHIFQTMCQLNEKFDFEDYFVSDTTLEQIFIMFARHQVKKDGEEEGKEGETAKK